MTDLSLEELAPGIFQLPILDEREADEIHGLLTRATGWDAAPIRKVTDTAPILRDDLRRAWEIRENAAPELFNRFERTVRTRAAALRARLAVGDFEFSEMRAVRYDDGGYFKVHSDTAGDDGRQFAIVIYLNDDFQGGATVFPLLGCRSTPKKGWGIVFPANRLHRGDVVTGGSKYVLVMWLVNPPVV